MYIQYLKQAWQLMKQNPFYSFVYILGTSLAISMVMIMAIVYYIRTGDIAPEVNRSRTLTLDYVNVVSKEGTSNSLGKLTWGALKQIVSPMETPLYIGYYVPTSAITDKLGEIRIKASGSEEVHQLQVKGTDDGFWQVCSFHFVSGRPYTKEEFQSGVSRSVIDRTLALRLFGTTGAEGQFFEMNGKEYQVAGVVEPISPAMNMAFANIWVPFTVFQFITEEQGFSEGTVAHTIHPVMVAEGKKDLEKVRQEFEQRCKIYNTSLKEFEIKEMYMQTIPRQFLSTLGDYGEKTKNIVFRYGLIALLFLLVPALNLSGLISSNMYDRMAETGIRKTFGAGRETLFLQVLTENLLYTVIGGLVGLIISWLIIASMGNFLLNISIESSRNSIGLIDASMFLNYHVFLWAFLFCLFLNFLSSFIPVWNAGKRSIIECMNDK